mgnify:CR=1 FL=1
MTKLRIRDFELQDFLDIEVSDHEKELRIGMPLARWAWIHKQTGPCYTVVDPEDRIVVCGGLHDLWPGVGDLWMTFSPLARKYPYILVVIKKILAGWMNWYWRIQGTSDATWPEAISFNEHFGAKREGVLRRYGPRGEDHIMYALVKGKAND